jgi:signal transduction histidine kinase
VAQPLGELARAARTLTAGGPVRLPRSRIPEVEELGRALRDTAAEVAVRLNVLAQDRAASAVLVDAMLEGVLATDRRGRIVTANPAARRLLGYGPGDALPDLPHLFRTKAARETVESAMRGAAIRGRELELDGRVVSVNARPLPSGGAVVVLHDLTTLRQLEVIRRDFVANVSHELKTPLTSITGYAETLLADEPDAETRRRFLETILSNARRMQRLVEDQLSLARIEGGGWQPHPEALEIEPTTRDAWEPFALRAEAGGVGFSLEVAPGAREVVADPEALRQVLGNLFDNALRHTPAGGRITLHTLARDGGVALAVADTGSGIPADHLPRIFERFYRADPGRARGAGGSGLGLAVVKHLVEGHGGRVSAESEVGRGTTVTCWFPGAVVT